MKHTPGPWKVSHMVDGTGHEMITVDQDVQGPFMEIVRSYDLDEESEKNLKIIASAPEMFDMLELVLYKIGYSSAQHPFSNKEIEKFKSIARKIRGTNG